MAIHISIMNIIATDKIRSNKCCSDLVTFLQLLSVYTSIGLLKLSELSYNSALWFLSFTEEMDNVDKLDKLEELK